jgi:predicted nucleic acid-binding protein
VKIYVDATTLIALGELGELDLLTSFDGTLWLLNPVSNEVETEPARSNLVELIEQKDVLIAGLGDDLLDEIRNAREEAKEVLDEEAVNGDVAILTRVIESQPKGVDVAVVSDDRRLRTVAEGLGARVTGTVGVVVRAVAEGRLTEQGAKELVRRLDSRGLHMTGELREKADDLIEDAARENEDGD